MPVDPPHNYCASGSFVVFTIVGGSVVIGDSSPAAALRALHTAVVRDDDLDATVVVGTARR